MQEIKQQQCPNCHRTIQSSRLALHIHMCSTIKLRQSQIILNQSSHHHSHPHPQQQQPNYTHVQNDINNGNNMTMCIFCSKQMKLGKLEEHMGGCQYRQIQCSGCGVMYPLNLLWQHRGVCKGKQVKLAHNQQQRLYNQVPANQPNRINLSSNNISYHENLHNNIENLKKNINNLGSKLLIQGNKLANYCNTLITQNKGPILQNLHKLKQSLYYKIQDIFVAIASDPNTDGLPPRSDKQNKLSTKLEITENKKKSLLHLEPIKILQCKHIFHPMCIDKWMKINRRCPVCKHDQSVRVK